MFKYVLKRIALMIPTLIGILALNFLIVQLAPGGPVDQIIAKLRDPTVSDVELRVGGASIERVQNTGDSFYRGSQGINPELIAELKEHFGLNEPAHIRFFKMLKNYLCFDFGNSYFKGRPVSELLLEKLPVSLSLGLWSTLLVYLISIPLGIRKALRHGSRFDVLTSGVVVVCYAIPSFLFALFLMILLAGGSFWQIFPLHGLVSDNFSELTFMDQVFDYFWHLALPIISISITGFAKLTLLSKNSFLEEINKQYVLTAYAKGLDQKSVLYKHIFRNAMLVIVAGFPAAFIAILFTSSLLIEVLFSLDGLGLLGFEAAMSRDYPVMFGTLYIFTLVGLLLHLIGDIAYMIVDPRIDLDSSRR